MMHAVRLALLVVCALWPTDVAAQGIDNWECKGFTQEQIDADRLRLMREVECAGSGPNAGQQIFGDELIFNMSTGEFEAVGNVLLVTPTSRLAAERVVFNTKTGLGSFYNASGTASLGDRGVQDRSMFGTLEPDIMFYGELIEKIGDDKYRITNGSFTTCVQPTPRWEVVTGSATLKLEDYAMLRNAVIRVKDVPLFYLPVMYYPIQSDDRATGFLLPTYGTSTVRGQSLSNAFFWAINRSQDLTLMHDWYTRTGQGVGAEYRYMLAPGAEGYLRGYRVDQKQSAIESGGSTTVLPEETSYEIRGAMAQNLPAGFRASGNVDYFTSLSSQQLYNTDLYYSSRSRRSISASLTGVWGGVSLTGQFQRAEYFESPTVSTVNGYAPSIRADLSSKRLGAWPIYFATTSEAANYVYVSRSGTSEQDASVWRVDVQPNVRVALSNWPFLAINAQVGFRNTYYSESLDDRGIQVPASVTRRYVDMRAEVVGPSFSRVFTPNNAIADRLKHVIEPTFSVQRVTNFDTQDRVPRTGGAYDFIVGGSTRLQYGLANRVLVRKAAAGEAASASVSAPRELLTVAVSQSYYTDAAARIYDVSYETNRQVAEQTHFSPVSVSVRSAPTTLTTATLRMELDQQDLALRTIGASGSSNYRSAQVTVGWTRTNYEQQAPQSFLNASSTFNLKNGRTGGTYALDWDISRGYLIQQRWIGFYNAQCCGITLEYQQFKFAQAITGGVPQDKRFNIGFTLAGIGTFSNFFGAFGGGRF